MQTLEMKTRHITKELGVLHERRKQFIVRGYDRREPKYTIECMDERVLVVVNMLAV